MGGGAEMKLADISFWYFSLKKQEQAMLVSALKYYFSSLLCLVGLHRIALFFFFTGTVC